jgi:hypothetical protein
MTSQAVANKRSSLTDTAASKVFKYGIPTGFYFAGGVELSERRPCKIFISFS